MFNPRYGNSNQREPYVPGFSNRQLRNELHQVYSGGPQYPIYTNQNYNERKRTYNDHSNSDRNTKRFRGAPQNHYRNQAQNTQSFRRDDFNEHNQSHYSNSRINDRGNRGSSGSGSRNIVQQPRDKADVLVDSVMSKQPGDLVIILVEGQHPFVSLMNSIGKIKGKNVIIKRIVDNEYGLFLISTTEGKKVEEEFVRATFDDKREAKIALAWAAIDKLHKTCFTIVKKNKLDHVSDSDLNTAKPKSATKSDHAPKAETAVTAENKTDPPAALKNTPLVGSIAHKMMLKMGWSGGGLGANEQGIEESIEVKENVDRRGLGRDNISDDIRNILLKFSRSNKITTLAFSKDFTKGERELIHNFCSKSRHLNLKTRSYGKGDERYITVSRKISNIDIIKELLRCAECENEYFKLVIPESHEKMYEELFKS